MQRPDVEKYEAMAEAAIPVEVEGYDWLPTGPMVYARQYPGQLLAKMRPALSELCAYIKHLEAAPATVWAVVYSNYDPAEVDSLWVSQALAEKHADTLGDDWRVVAWKARAEEAVK